MNTLARSETRSMALRAVVIRVDGRTENLGLISFKHKNPFIHYAVNAYIRLKDFFNDRSRTK
jgi:hypothetical protein